MTNNKYHKSNYNDEPIIVRAATFKLMHQGISNEGYTQAVEKTTLKIKI